jgi:hypothetical protein
MIIPTYKILVGKNEGNTSSGGGGGDLTIDWRII